MALPAPRIPILFSFRCSCCAARHFVVTALSWQNRHALPGFAERLLSRQQMSYLDVN